MTKTNTIATRRMPLDRELALHDAARDQAEAVYRKAVAKAVAVAEAEALASLRDADDAQERAKRRHREEETIALLLLLAGEAAYFAMYNQLAAVQRAAQVVAPPAPYSGLPGPVPTPKPQSGGQNAPQAELGGKKAGSGRVFGLAEEFAKGRAPLLEAFPQWVNRKLDAEVAESQAAGRTNKQVAQRLGRLARSMEQGRGWSLAASEAQATYGDAQRRLLTTAGFSHKIWMTCDDDRVRPTHVDCGLQGEVRMDKPFSNGLQYPGDPNGGPEETANCRCWLVGGSRA